MREKFKNRILFGLVTILPVVCFAGSVTSTFAWYTYNYKVNVYYSGTSVIANKQLQVGIETDIDLTEYGLTTEDGIAWAVPGSTLTADCINYYLTESGHASKELFAVTSRGYEVNENLTLYEAITDEIHTNEQIAEISKYVQVPLTFRVIDLTTNLPVPNRQIWLSYTQLRADDYNAQNGIRVHFDDGSSRYIYNPSATTDDGSTTIGALLDMNNDGFYDYNMDDKNEIIFGDLVSGTPTYEKQIGVSELDDVNHTGETTASSFLSRHQDQVNKVSNFDSLVFDQANYYSQATIYPDKTAGAGHLKDGKPVCVTSNDSDAIGKTDMTIWLEGWDHVVVDRILNLKFDLILTFEINYV